MEERHKVEKEALEAEMDVEAAAMEREMNESIETEHEESLKQLHKEIISDVKER